ncbi:tumor necrosis factor alpha-induced protein 2-like isoform X2 [Paramisgurnus dabryanus]|uniref:tumor necrosis factor alpha-induced protein 2-like isoform X2 n=1 Tax=Paramisgurnus dabryanus TaxID=90735 RepID=UPI0031F398D6
MLRKMKKGLATDSTQGSSGDPEMEPQKNKESDKKAFLDLKKFSKSGPEMPTETAEELDFNGNLEQNRLDEAQKLLVAAEERLFGSNKPARAEEEEGELLNNYQYFIAHLEMIINDSFIEDNQERLKSAVTAILQEEAQDKRWETLAVEKRPSWRPTMCRKNHDTQLKAIVEKRMKNANEQENGANELSTPLKREVCRMGKQIQKDLLVVARRLRECYPPDFDICRIYAQLYHQAFSNRLQELTRSKVDVEDCCYILSWIVFHYPSEVLNHKELKEHIDQTSLGPLLPEGTLKILHEQYFLHKEKEVRKWLSNAFGKEFRKWSDGIEPQLMDGVYFSSLAVDILPLIDSSMKEIKSVFGSERKNEFILCQLDSYLKDYRKNLEEFIKVKQGGAAKTLCANLVTVHQFRDYVQEKESLFPEKTKTSLLFTLADIKTDCQQYFLSQIHAELKPLYRKLWTDAWCHKHDKVLDDLVKALENHIHRLKPLKSICREELLGELHLAVMVEYVRRMMKKKLKLKKKKQQEEAAEFMGQDSKRICSTFANAGSNVKWLSEILPRLSEILKLQDPGSLKLEIVSLARIYPDLSQQHVVAVLTMKSNLSSSDVCEIKDCLRENRDPQDDQSSPSFFSKVIVKKKMSPPLLSFPKTL